MNTMKTILASTLILTAMSASQALAKTKSVAVDPAASSIKWTGKKVTGQHNGLITLKSGAVDVEKDTVKGGQFEFDMSSIKVEDIKDAENNAKLTGHLKSDDFFAVAKHATSTFKITSVKALKDSKEGTHEITGDLTIKGITHPVTFPATVEVKGDKASAKGKVTVDRTKYDIKYNSGKFYDKLGDKMINDTFELELDLKSKT
ncbi:MAG: YceI family protein [Pseudobdellovibrionaceae bacterium]